MKSFIFFTLSILFLSSTSFAGTVGVTRSEGIACELLADASPIQPQARGCCSSHGGVCGCSGGRSLCCDGTLSPSCTCTSTTYTLSVTQTGSGSGTIGGGGQYEQGDSVNLAATPNAGSTFAGWSPSPCAASFTMPANNLTCTATFNTTAPNTHNLTVDKAGTGSGIVTGTGIHCGSNCTESYASGTSVTLTATPASGSTFAGWSGACSGTGSCTVTIDAAKSVIATFNGESNPSSALVSHYYEAILGRTPDAGGQAFWEGEVQRSQALGIAHQEAFRVMANQFFTSDEYVSKNTSDTQFVTDLYHTFFRREPDASGLSFWMGQLAASLPRDITRYSFLFSTEFDRFMENQFGASASRAEVDIIVDFYRGLLKRLPDSAGFYYWQGRFQAAQCQDAVAVTAEVDAISALFVNSNEYRNRERDSRQYVTDLYDAFLRRDSDLGGFNYWVGQLDSGAQTREQLRRVFRDSNEFQTRINRAVSEVCADDLLTGQATAVTDGDTFTLLATEGSVITIRLGEIDAPESDQPYGLDAQQSLNNMILGQEIRIVVQDTDRYGRTVGRVYAGTLDVNKELVRQGWAWAYLDYLQDTSLIDTERQAREAKWGLWGNPNPIPPWEWRQGVR
jgi:endonuclease YncB( thermonuclease family)